MAQRVCSETHTTTGRQLEGDAVVILLNPIAGRRSADPYVRQVEQAVRSAGFATHVLTNVDEAVQLATELRTRRKLRAFLAAGGDGTVGAIANAVDPNLPVSFLPVGTANLFARHLRLPTQPRRVCEMVQHGSILQVDIGVANGRKFVIMASCGFDAEVATAVHVARQSNSRDGHIGYRNYLEPIWRTARSYRFPQIRVSCLDDAGQVTEELVVHWVVVCNIPRYGWGLKLAPSATENDGLLDACCIRGASLFSGLAHAALAQMGGLHRFWRSCVFRKGKKFRIDCSVPVRCQLDGDPAGTTPLEIEVLPSALSVVVPPRKKMSWLWPGR